MKRVLIIILFLSAASWAQDAAKKPALKTDVSPGAPRFQLFVNPSVRQDTFLLDTATGKVWRMIQMADALGEPTVWRSEDRIDNLDEEVAWWKSHALKPEAVKAVAAK